ncbi:MAG: HAMP domain-containing sensor histidine kinase [Pseudomonadota bacterium]
MDAPQDHDGKLLEAGGTPAVIIRNKEKILARFCERAQSSLAGARGVSHPVIVDTLPGFITRLALALSPDSGKEFASQYSNMAYQHGNERARFSGYTLREMIKEYQFIREIIVAVLRAEASPTDAEWTIVHRSVDEGIAEAVTAFVKVHDGIRELFTATLTHDFRGPLSNAWNYVELMRRTTEESQREQFANRAVDNMRRIDRMVSELLDVSRRNAGERMSLDPQEGDAGELVREVLDDFATRAAGRLVLSMDRPISVYWSKKRMCQALHNLIENALKYGRADSQITVRVLETHDRIHLSVHNFGEAIPPAEQATLFQPYQRSAAATLSGKSGWGLGLALVEAIAEAHNGVVGVESTEEDGTTFTLDVMRDLRMA